MFVDTNVTIPGAKLPKYWFKNRYKITKKKRFGIYNRVQVFGKCIFLRIF